MRKFWIMGMLVAALLAVGVMWGTALAHGGGADGESRINGLFSRVAEKLGLSDEQVQQAFQEARQEMRDEALQSKLDAKVEAGLLTQEEADEYLEWYQSKPSIGFEGFSGKGIFKGHSRGGYFRGHGIRFHQEESVTPTPDISGAVSF